ncbi:microsomal glutathione S-transferase 1 [Strongylocentrotus purpuratus]|uniref:Microsomal glutathione S-transferase 1 n=1 Tax=Strongylocentrotus purpuratus TaxID=7668 RepID=A0A7M7RG87_STRPU|nr:microsomal glutathione S-transferase 1 [Strongylocentrotus purpuratus]|eukprot:XP_784920.3 PREDICTED: microsomal glutathione S-transferase 1 [Strongylocentrotus purpuratus]
MAATMSEELSCFATYASAVMVKMVLMSLLTGYMRATRKVFANREDMVGYQRLIFGLKDQKPVFDNPIVERVRRCHLNDLENIVPFFGLGLLYAVTSGATTTTIVWHYRIFVASRFLHTIAYIGALPQPSRALSFFAGLVVNVSMAVQIIMNNWNSF